MSRERFSQNEDTNRITVDHFPGETEAGPALLCAFESLLEARTSHSRKWYFVPGVSSGLGCGGSERLLKFIVCRVAGDRAEGCLLIAGWVSHRNCRRLHQCRYKEQPHSRPENVRPQRSRTECRAQKVRLTGAEFCGREITSGKV